MRRTGWKQRATGATLALLVQFSFLAMILLTPARLGPLSSLTRETILLLPQSRKADPSIIDARMPTRSTATLPVPQVPSIVAPVGPSPLAPPSGIAGFGRALFGCAPEHYAELPPDERAHCPKPGEGVAMNQQSEITGTRSHVKDEAHWRQEWARVHSPSLLPCGGFADVMCLLGKIMDGSLSDYGDPSKWPTYAVEQLPDRDFRKIEETYKAWQKEHPVRAN